MFTIKSKDGKARTGVIKTRHGEIETPFYMPVATKGAVKYMESSEMEALGYEIMISNALINYFRPGLEMFKKTGDLHNFMNWKGALTTDSGGFQSLDDNFLMKTTREGAVFKNPFTKINELITPEKLMMIQETIGSDIAMVFDDVPKFGTSHKAVFDSMVITHEWARRCVASHKREDQLLFGIAQGGVYKDLREHSTKYISSLGFDGIALGGLAIGEPTSSMFDVIEHSIPFTPEDKPKYLMGVGSPIDIVKSIGLGVDMFDSTFPTCNARHSSLFTFNGVVKIRNAKYREDFGPIEDGCECPTCKKHTRAFVHHMMRTHEPVGKKLCTVHNLHFMQEMIRRARAAIEAGEYKKFEKEFIENFSKKT